MKIKQAGMKQHTCELESFCATASSLRECLSDLFVSLVAELEGRPAAVPRPGCDDSIAAIVPPPESPFYTHRHKQDPNAGNSHVTAGSSTTARLR